MNFLNSHIKTPKLMIEYNDLEDRLIRIIAQKEVHSQLSDISNRAQKSKQQKKIYWKI